MVNLALAYARPAAPTGRRRPGRGARSPWSGSRSTGHNLHPCGRTRLGWDTTDVLAHDLEAGHTRSAFVAVRRRPAPRRRRRRRARGRVPGAARAAARLPACSRCTPGSATRSCPPVRRRCSATARCGSSTASSTPRPTAALRTLLLPPGPDGRRRYLKVSLDIQVTSTRRSISRRQHPQRPGAVRAAAPAARRRPDAAGCCCWPRPPARRCRPAPAATCRRSCATALDRPARSRRDAPCPAARCRDRRRRRSAGPSLAAPADARRARAGFLADVRPAAAAAAAAAGRPARHRRWRRTCRTACPRSSAGCRTGWRCATSPACACTRGRLAAAGHRRVAVARARWSAPTTTTCMRAKIGYTAFQAHLGELVDPARRVARAGRGRRLAGGPGRASTRRTTALGRRPAPRADHAALHRADRCRTRRWCGCGWPAAATCTCRCRIRCMRRLSGSPRRCARGRGAGLRLRLRPRRRCATGPPRCAPRCPPGTTLLYAVKANGHPDVVAHPGRGAATALEVASGGELALAVAAGARPDRVRRARPRPTPSWPPRVAAGAQVNVESAHELRRLDRAARRGRRRSGPRCGSTGRRRGAARQPRDDRHAHPVRRRRGAAGRRRSRWPPACRSGSSASTCTPCPTTSTRPRTPRFVADALDWSVATAARHRRAAAIRQRRRRLRRRLPRRRAPRPRPRCAPAGRPPPAASTWSSSRAGASPPTPAGTPPRCSTSSTPTAAGSRCCAAAPTTSGCPPPGATATRSPCCRSTRWPYPFDRPEVARRRRSTRSASCARRATCSPAASTSTGCGSATCWSSRRTGAYGWDISHHDFLRHPHPDVLMLGAAPVGRLST